MKSSVIPILSLLVALAALFVAIENRATQAEIDQRVELALIQRERAYAHAAFPQFDRVYNGLLKGTYSTPKAPPDTFAELLNPMITVIGNLTGNSENE